MTTSAWNGAAVAPNKKRRVLPGTRLSFGADFYSALTGEAQPPLPLQEFLAAQPLSLVLQPPCALQSFLPLQSCLAVAQLPLPLHSFLPAAHLSPALQPPLPLHELRPLHECRSFLSADLPEQPSLPWQVAFSMAR